MLTARAGIPDHLITNYHGLLSDPRVEKWLLMDNPINTALILVGYFVLIFAIKTVMASRDPLELKSFIFVYNIFQVAVSFYIGYEVSPLSLSSTSKRQVCL